MSEGRRSGVRAALALAAPLLLGACAPAVDDTAPRARGTAAAEGVSRFDPPAAAGALAPYLALEGEAALLSWLEPAGESGHRLRYARFDGGSWGEPVTIAEGDRFFANWADTPILAAGPEGELLVSWLEKTGDAPYAYGIRLARSDDGTTWRPLGFLHDDDTPTEHGFVSLFPDSAAFRAVWLDGRQMMDEGPMTLRTALVGREVGPATVLDERVCDCCQTAAAMAPEGAVVAYRDRSEGEIRDISVVRQTNDGWSGGATAGGDGWVMPACPVNGPALAAAGSRLALAWFTAADGIPRVQVAFSGDGGASFDPPVEVAREGALGRVGVVLDGDGGALVTWLAAEAGRGEILLARVSPGGQVGPPLAIAETGAGRASGFPRLARAGERLYLAWTEAGEEGSPTRLRFAVLPLVAGRHPASS